MTSNSPTLRDRELLRGSDDLLVDFDRGFKIFHEFVSGCRQLYDIGPTVTIFGSARFEEGHRYYEMARETARRLAEGGYGIMMSGPLARASAPLLTDNRLPKHFIDVGITEHQMSSRRLTSG